MKRKKIVPLQRLNRSARQKKVPRAWAATHGNKRLILHNQGQCTSKNAYYSGIRSRKIVR